MAFKATLIMGRRMSSAADVEAYGGKKYELVECEYEFYQSLDESGMICSSITGCLTGPIPMTAP